MLTLAPSTILIGDTIEQMATLPDGCVQCCVTSPPYWGLRDYGVEGQIGLEESPEAFVAKMVEVFRAVRRVLRDDGTLWLNLGDSYAAGGRGGNPNGPTSTLQGGKESQEASIIKRYRRQASTAEHGSWSTDEDDGRGGARIVAPGLKPKDLCLIPWRVVLALQADGWWVRSTICWAKKSPMPESCTDRPTTAWEPIFLLAKSERYFYDAEAVKEPASPGTNARGPEYKRSPKAIDEGEGVKNNGSWTEATWGPVAERNQRNVWHLGHEPYSEAHFATFPTEIPRRAIKAGTSEKGCCPECRAPWRRVTSRSKVSRERPSDYVKREGEEGTGNSCANSVAGVSVRTLGWEPTCGCVGGDGGPHSPVPCLVLDPFLGSGTTVAVARELGRWGVGCELNPKYAELARERIRKSENPVSYQDMREPANVAEAAPLFAMGAEVPT